MKYYLAIIPESLFHNAWAKLLASMILIFTPFYSAILTLLALILVDFITGIYRSTKTVFINEKPQGCLNKLKLFWKNIQSRKLRYSIEKMATYGIVIFVFNIFSAYVFPLTIGGYSIVNVIIGLLCIIELRSITENLSSISNNAIFKKIFSLFEKKIKDKTGVDIDDNTQYTALNENK